MKAMTSYHNKIYRYLSLVFSAGFLFFALSYLPVTVGTAAEADFSKNLSLIHIFCPEFLEELDVDPAGFSPSAEATGDSSSPVPVSSEKTSSNPFDSFEISPMSPEESWLEPDVYKRQSHSRPQMM